MSSTAGPLRLGVLVPCRNEAAVLPAKLANLGMAEWPEHPRAHRLVVIDNGSSDGTAEVAAALLAEHFGARPAVETQVVSAPGGGKPAALRAGLEAIADCDLVVVTDADVRLEATALTELARAFAAFPDLASPAARRCSSRSSPKTVVCARAPAASRGRRRASTIA